MYLPAGHSSEQYCEPAGLCLPTGHTVQTVAAPAPEKYPAVHCWQLEDCTEDEYCPSGQEEHAALPLTAYLPLEQTTQVSVAAISLSVHWFCEAAVYTAALPGEHGVHASLPSEMNPGLHFVHEVYGGSEAFPTGQAPHTVAPAGEYEALLAQDLHSPSPLKSENLPGGQSVHVLLALVA